MSDDDSCSQSAARRQRARTQIHRGPCPPRANATAAKSARFASCRARPSLRSGRMTAEDRGTGSDGDSDQMPDGRRRVSGPRKSCRHVVCSPTRTAETRHRRGGHAGRIAIFFPRIPGWRRPRRCGQISARRLGRWGEGRGGLIWRAGRIVFGGVKSVSAGTGAIHGGGTAHFLISPGLAVVGRPRAS